MCILICIEEIVQFNYIALAIDPFLGWIVIDPSMSRARDQGPNSTTFLCAFVFRVYLMFSKIVKTITIVK